MIEKLIAFLQWIQGSESLKKWVDRFFSFLILFVTATLLWVIYKEAIGNCSRYYGCSDIFPWDTLPEIILGGFFSAAIILSLAYGAGKKIISYEYSVMRLLLNVTLPFLTGLILLTIYRESLINSYRSGPGWYLYFFGGLYAISPILHTIKSYNTRDGISKKILNTYSRYIVSFLIGLVIFSVIFGLSNIFGEMRYMHFAEIVLFLFIVFCLFSLGTWLILTYAWDEVKPVDETSSRNIRKGAVWIAAFFVLIWISPNWKETFIDDRIAKAEELLTKGGNTSLAYKDAAGVWGLKWAMKERYLENRLYNKDLYSRIFDKSIESDIEDEIDVNKFRTWNSNGTSMLARGENAKVELNFAKHESEIKSDIGAMETTVTYEFQNTDTQNQEVIYSIELPSSNAVVTDLRLGLNLELTGTLAPRGAAEKVYNDSLRRNTDPALLEQTGPTTYRLRVFPVPSVSDPTTQGRQRVSLRYVTPISSGDDITLMPKTDILNLKLTKKSEIMTRVMEGTKPLVQESFKTSDISDLISGKKVSVKLEVTLKDSLSYCAINTYEGLDIAKLKTGEKNLTKNIVFLDISKSAGDDKKIRDRYQELIDAWKNNGAALDIYTFNTLVTSAGYDLSDLTFWGNTDMASVISYISKNTIENANIVILTDDESYESGNPEDKTIDYKKLKSNRISLVVLGDKIRTLKTEVTKSILASEGDILRLAPIGSLDEELKSIFTPKKLPATCEAYNGNNTGALSALEGGRDGKKLLGESHSGTQLEKKEFRPTYLYGGKYYNKTNYEYSEFDRYQMPLPDINGNMIQVYDSNKDETGAMLVPKDGHYFLSGNTFVESDNKTYYNTISIPAFISDSMLLESIGERAHIVNQSMSLIALENDRQRQDLERYSNQDGKYDTTYQNFNNTNQVGGTPGWNRREIMIDDMAMPMSAESSRTMQANTMFGATKSSSVQIANSNDSVGGGILSVGSSVGTRGGLLQILAIIILFPVMAWYVLRKKKPQAESEAKNNKKPE